MAKIRLDKQVKTGIAVGLAVAGIAIGGFGLSRRKSSRGRGALTFGIGIAAGLGTVLVWSEWNRRQSRRSKGRPVTQALVPITPADMPIGQPGENLEDRLDEAVHETFPASDPISVRIE